MHLLRGNRRVAGRRIDIPPALEPGLGLDPDEEAALDRGHAVHAVDRRAQRDVDDDRLDRGDPHRRSMSPRLSCVNGTWRPGGRAREGGRGGPPPPPPAPAASRAPPPPPPAPPARPRPAPGP